MVLFSVLLAGCSLPVPLKFFSWATDGIAYLTTENLSDPKALTAARQRLGEEAIVGVGCGASRHDAITAAEHGADYVAFGTAGQEPGPAEIELIGWWQSIMTLPCVAFGAAAPGDCALLAGAGVDFVVVHPGMDLAACRAALNQS